MGWWGGVTFHLWLITPRHCHPQRNRLINRKADNWEGVAGAVDPSSVGVKTDNIQEVPRHELEIDTTGICIQLIKLVDKPVDLLALGHLSPA